MTILDTIVAYKQKEVSAKKEAFPISLLEKSLYFKRETKSMASALKNSETGIIAEHKRKSPSKSTINDNAFLEDVVIGYKNAGVSAMSILTDTKFFGGSLDDLLLARSTVNTPLLRKEFIIDPYQIYETKAFGADAILLIAACLGKKQLKEYSKIAKSLGLDVLLEVHNEIELQKSLHTTVDMIGVNNRDLKTFKVAIENSMHLSQEIPKEFVKVSESGISSIDAVKQLKPYGYKGFLIGEKFMKTEDPGVSAAEFIKKIN